MWQERARDAAFAANISTSWKGIVCGYINGGDPFHPWTKADWARFPDNPKLPIFVRDDPTGGSLAYNDAFTALRDLYVLGVTKGAYVALDRETSKDTTYDSTWASIIRWGGFKPVQYYSESTGTTPGFNWDWVAWYRNIGPFMAARPAAMTQYANGNAYDSSTVRPWLYQFGTWWK